MAFKEIFTTGLVFALLKAGNCCFNVNMDSTGGVITPITQGGRYQSNVECTYTITQFAPAGLVFEFSKMDVEVDDSWKPCKSDMYTCTRECDENDWVAIKETSTGVEVVRRCDNNVPNFQYRTSGPATVWFHTDNNIERTGFTLNFWVDPDTVPCTTTTTLSGRASGTITSYTRSDGKYRANEDCKWKVSVPGNYNTIKFSFKKMDVDGSCGSASTTCTCPKDWLAIYDGDTDGAPLITERCGFSTPSISFYTSTSSSPVAFIRFKTDATVQYTGWQLTYEGCVAPCETTSTSTTTTTTTQKPIVPWPRADALLGFWPLDRNNKLEDVSQYKRHCDEGCHGQVSDSQAGPFGDMATSYQTNGRDESILSVTNALQGTRSFTVAFFARIPSSIKTASGILSFMTAAAEQVFAIDAVTVEGVPKLQVRAGASTTNNIYGPYDIIQPDVWTFVAVAFDNSLCTLQLYGQFGEVYMGSYKKGLCDNVGLAQKLRIGVASADSDSSFLASSAAVSCVSVYSAALKYADIVSVHEACRVAHGTPPCGSPRIPLSLIPSSNSAIPTYGQFPYIASLRRSTDTLNPVCSATIINRFYLLTAATCFSGSKEPLDYTVYVGDHDLGIAEPYEVKHSIGKITISDEFNVTFDNLALIELANPIELSNYYVNTICLPEASDLPKSNAYFFGWGNNGRPAQTRSTLPRYVAGSKLSDNACNVAWGGSYLEGYSTCFQSTESSYQDVPCSGDEGGPLLVAANTLTQVDARLLPIGIYGARYGDDCSSAAPALFASLAPYDIKHRIACNIPGHFYPDNCPVNYA